MLALLVSAPAPALAGKGQWLLDRLIVDTGAVFGFRAGWADAQRGGFQAAFGGGEGNVGFELPAGFAILSGARVMYGASSADDQGIGSLSYLEATGHLAAQVRLTDWVRLEAGASAGRIFRCCQETTSGSGPAVNHDEVSVVAGGYLRFGVDFLPRSAALLRALSLHVRVDLSGHPLDTTQTLPTSSLALSASLGIRL